MPTTSEHFKHRSGDSHVLLVGLVRIRVGAQHDGLADVRWRRELPLQHVPYVSLVEQTRLEIASGREAHVRVARTSVTVDAPMTAPPVRVNRVLKPDIRRVIGTDDAFRAIGLQGRFDTVGPLLAVPA